MPNGERFMTHAELKEQAEAERQRADSAEQQAETERQRAHSEQRVNIEYRRAERLAAILREHGIDADSAE